MQVTVSGGYGGRVNPFRAYSSASCMRADDGGFGSFLICQLFRAGARRCFGRSHSHIQPRLEHLKPAAHVAFRLVQTST